jgi:hypothetical protein
MRDDKALHHDPLRESDVILTEDFYGRPRRPRREPAGEASSRPRRASKPKPTHYKVVCISLYTREIEMLKEMVAELKRRGYTRANKSQVIRFALDQLDLDSLPPPRLTQGS